MLGVLTQPQLWLSPLSNAARATKRVLLHRQSTQAARPSVLSAYEHIDSLRTIDVRTIVGREDARKYRLKHVVVFFHSVKKI